MGSDFEGTWMLMENIGAELRGAHRTVKWETDLGEGGKRKRKGKGGGSRGTGGRGRSCAALLKRTVNSLSQKYEVG